MNTMENYEEDSSAQGRLRAWHAARQMALDYPLGVGANNFSSAYGRFYIPADTARLRRVPLDLDAQLLLQGPRRVRLSRADRVPVHR